MVFVFWGAVIGGLVLATVVSRWLTREKYAEMAAHMTQAEVSDPSLLGTHHANSDVAGAGSMFEAQRHSNHW